MNDKTLDLWLAQDRSALTRAVTESVRDHVASLESRGIDFYGYALLPGEPYDINRLVVAVNCASDIKVEADHYKYIYYKYSVDEWKYWEREGFDKVNRQLVDANAAFSSMHSKSNTRCQMDEYEIRHSNASLEAILRGLEIAKGDGVFGTKDPFLAIWISDSGHEIINRSVGRLNSESVMYDFFDEFE